MQHVLCIQMRWEVKWVRERKKQSKIERERERVEKNSRFVKIKNEWTND